MSGSWHLAMLGLPWWLVLAVLLLASWISVRLIAAESRGSHPATPWILGVLRTCTIAAVCLLLLEPTLSHQSMSSELPSVAVLVDTSGSMAVVDPNMSAMNRLNEAVALGLVPADIRPDPWLRAAGEVERFDADLDALVSAGRGEEVQQGRAQPLAQLCHEHLVQEGVIAQALAGSPDFAEHFSHERRILERLAARLEAPSPGPPDAALTADIAAFRQRTSAIISALLSSQAASDASLVAAAMPDSPLAQGLRPLSQLTRYARARSLLERTIRPALANRAKVDELALIDQAPPLSEIHALQGPTDFATPLSHLARGWPQGGDSRAAGVLILSDGRQTAGTDPGPAARTLASRGAPVWCICIGDPEQPRDAVVAEVRGPQEVFKGETVRLDVRLRITGYASTPWDLVLERDGKELERRSVTATGTWQTERFQHQDSEPGLHSWRARLERPHATAPLIRPGGGLLREVWNGIPGTNVAQVLDVLRRDPNQVLTITAATTHDVHDSYLERWRGWIVPPLTGTYTFWVSSDDSSELSLSTTASPLQLQPIARVPEWCPPGVWDQFQSQRSPPVPLEAGRPYYLQVLHKQSIGDAHCAIGWQLPDNQLERPIPVTRLAPWPLTGSQPTLLPDLAPEASIENNQADCTVAVIDDPLQVLLIDAEPRWDTRYLVTMFERDPRARVDRRYRSGIISHGEHELLPSTQDQLDGYDVVVLGDIAADELSADDQVRLERFVAERGGFLILISGPRGMPSSYGLGGIADLLPVHLAATTGDPHHTTTVALPSALTSAAIDSPITAILDDPILNRRLWPALPALQWFIPGTTPKAGADVLVTAQDLTQSPIVAVQRYGAGRVLWTGSDETWRWRDRLGERVHQTFWLQAVRWGLGSRLHGHDPRLQAAVDRLLIEPGGSLELLTRSRTSGGLLIRDPPTARLQRLDDHGQAILGSAQNVDMREVAGSAGLFHAIVGGLDEGRWLIEFSSPHRDLIDVRETRQVLVRHRADQEGIELAADPVNLQRIATAGAGRSVGIEHAADLLRDISAQLHTIEVPHRRNWQVWGGYSCLAVVVGLLTIEWLVRRRRGLP